MGSGGRRPGGQPQVVALDDVARRADVGDIDREPSGILDVAEGDIHAALGRLADVGGFADLPEAKPFVVRIEFGDTIVVGKDQIGVAGPAQIRRADRECPPVIRAQPHLLRHVLELPAAHVVQEVLAPAVLGVLEIVRHHARVLQVGQVDIVGVVAADQEVQLAVVVVIHPRRAVGVHPGGQAGLVGDARKAFAAVVVKNLRLAPLVDQ